MNGEQEKLDRVAYGCSYLKLPVFYGGYETQRLKDAVLVQLNQSSLSIKTQVPLNLGPRPSFFYPNTTQYARLCCTAQSV